MPNERFRMRQDIFQLRRSSTPAEEKRVGATRDNGTDSRGNAGAGNREPAVPSTPVGSDQRNTLLDVSEVADYLRISRSSVYKLIERQQIPAIRIGRLLRVRKDELDKTLRSMGSGA